MQSWTVEKLRCQQIRSTAIVVAILQHSSLFASSCQSWYRRSLTCRTNPSYSQQARRYKNANFCTLPKHQHEKAFWGSKHRSSVPVCSSELLVVDSIAYEDMSWLAGSVEVWRHITTCAVDNLEDECAHLDDHLQIEWYGRNMSLHYCCLVHSSMTI